MHILVCSASNKAPMIRAVQHAAWEIDAGINVIAGDTNKDALSRHVADDFWLMPLTDAAHLSQLIDGCKLRNISTIVPSRDGELLFFARHSEHFKDHGIQVIVSPESTIAICIDKLKFGQLGGAVIPSFKQPISGAYFTKQRFPHSGIDHTIYQPYIEGVEISVDAWADKDHAIKGVVLRRREVVTNGESRVTTTFRDQNLEREFGLFLERLKVRGPVVLQAFLTPDQHFIIECNARFGGASTASIAVGLHGFYWSLLEQRGEEIPPFTRSESEVRQIRVPEDIHVYLD